MKRQPGQSELEDLSAYLDGELSPDRKAQVEALLLREPAWRAELAQLKAVDAALDAQVAPPAPADLPERVIGYVRRAQRHGRLVKRLRVAGAVAAAIVLIAAALGRYVRPRTAPPPTRTADARAVQGNSAKQAEAELEETLRDVAGTDRFVVENIDFFRDFDVLVNYETLEAIDRLQPVAGGV